MRFHSKNENNSRSIERQPLMRLALDAQIPRQRSPSAFVTERAHPFNIRRVYWKAVAQGDDLVKWKQGL